jgi:hypothetical protein
MSKEIHYTVNNSLVKIKDFLYLLLEYLILTTNNFKE